MLIEMVAGWRLAFRQFVIVDIFFVQTCLKLKFQVGVNCVSDGSGILRKPQRF
jgi:hypothetical protein